MKQHLFKILILFACIVISIIYYKHWQEEKKLKKVFLEKVTLKDSYKDFFNKVILKNVDTSKVDFYYINIWHTSCIPCIKEMPYLDSLTGMFNDNVKGFTITDQDEDKIASFLDKKNVHLKHLMSINDLENFVAGLSNDGQIMKYTYPVHIILNKKLEVLAKQIGASPNKNITLENDFKKYKLLKGSH